MKMPSRSGEEDLSAKMGRLGRLLAPKQDKNQDTDDNHQDTAD
jgi:hypothetical protein